MKISQTRSLRHEKQSKRTMFQTLDQYTRMASNPVKISKARAEKFLEAMKAGKSVSKKLRAVEDFPFNEESEPIYQNEAKGLKIYGLLEETAKFEGNFYIAFFKNPVTGLTQACVGFSKQILSNFCERGAVEIPFLSSKDGSVLDVVDVACQEYAFQGAKTLFVVGDEAAAKAAVTVISSAKPGAAKNATNFNSGLKIMGAWDAGASEYVMEAGLVTQLAGSEASFKQLGWIWDFCEKKGVAAKDVLVVEATDDSTWGAGLRDLPKLAAGDEITEAYLAAKIPLLAEAAVFEADGSFEFKGGKNKLGKILSRLGQTVAAAKGNHAAFCKEVEAKKLFFVVEEEAAECGESPKRAAAGGEESPKRAAASGEESPKRAAGEAAEEQREPKRAGRTGSMPYLN